MSSITNGHFRVPLPCALTGTQDAQDGIVKRQYYYWPLTLQTVFAGTQSTRRFYDSTANVDSGFV